MVKERKMHQKYNNQILLSTEDIVKINTKVQNRNTKSHRHQINKGGEIL